MENKSSQTDITLTDFDELFLKRSNENTSNMNSIISKNDTSDSNIIIKYRGRPSKYTSDNERLNARRLLARERYNKNKEENHKLVICNFCNELIKKYRFIKHCKEFHPEKIQS